MSELRRLLSDTTEQVLGGLDGLDFATAWARAEEAGLATVLVPEDRGGFGGTWDDAFIVVHACGYHAVTLPLPEAILASALCADANLPIPPGSLSLCEQTQGAVTNAIFRGEHWRVPFGAQCNHIVGILGDEVIVAAPSAAKDVGVAHNLAEEPRNSFFYADVPASAALSPHWDYLKVYHYSIMMHAARMAGALRGALDLSVQYAQQRQQFGRPLASFQVIQQQLAVFAEETAAADMAAAAAFASASKDSSVAAPAQWREPSFEIMAAKLRANQAARISTGIAHQVHGAMGFTAEYRLQHLTRRLWAWSSEFGNERHWADRIGARIAERGPENFWPDMTG